MTNKPKKKSKPSLLSLAGKNKGSGLFQSAAEVDAYIAKFRAEWK